MDRNTKGQAQMIFTTGRRRGVGGQFGRRSNSLQSTEGDFSPHGTSRSQARANRSAASGRTELRMLFRPDSGVSFGTRRSHFRMIHVMSMNMEEHRSALFVMTYNA